MLFIFFPSFFSPFPSPSTFRLPLRHPYFSEFTFVFALSSLSFSFFLSLSVANFEAFLLSCSLFSLSVSRSFLQGNEREILWFLNKPINGEDGSEWISRIGVRLTFLRADTEGDGIGLSSVSSRLDTTVARKLYSKITWVFSCCSWSRFPRRWLERRRLQCLLGKRWWFLLDGDSLIGIFQLLGGGGDKNQGNVFF